MKANVIFSNFFSPEKAQAARELLEQLHIEISDQTDEDRLPKIKIITKSFNEIPFIGKAECLTMTPLCLQQIISMNTASDGSEINTNLIKNPFDLQDYGDFFYNLFLFNKKISFGNISDEEKERLTKKIVYMGGKVVSLDDANVNYILTDKKCENPHKVLLILPSWIDSLFESSIEISTDRFRVDEGESISAEGSPKINSAKNHIYLTIPEQPLLSQNKNFSFKNKNASSQPVISSKGKTRKTGKGIPKQLDSRQMILNFAKAKPEAKSQSPDSLSTSGVSQTRKQVVLPTNKQKTLHKALQLKANDNVMKIDNFMKSSKDVTPVQSSQLIVTVDGNDIKEKDTRNSDDDDGSNDEAINEEVRSYEKKMEQKVLRSIKNKNLRAHGKLVEDTKSSDEENPIGPFNSTKNKVNESKSSNSKNTSLKKLSIIPSILNEMTENQLLSSDNEADYISNNDKRKNSDISQSFDLMESLRNDLIEFSSDLDSKSPKRVTIHPNNVNDNINNVHESELIRDLTSFSQSSEFGESQNAYLTSVYYDSRPNKAADNEESQKTESMGNDPLMDYWESFQGGSVNMNNE